MNKRIYNCIFVIVVMLLLGSSSLEAQTTFTESANDAAPAFNALALNGRKDGGHAWCDFDDDGDLDVLVNRGDFNDNTFKSILLRNEGGGVFTDITVSNAPFLNNQRARERSAVWADVNNDGYMDFARNTGGNGASKLEIYIQDPVSGIFSDGNGGGSPFRVGNNAADHINISNGLNMEGMGFFDFEGDGDLDLIVDNHNFGLDILRNNHIDHTTGAVVNPALAGKFTHATPGTGTVLGLNQTSTDGDYGSVTDFDDDGWVDAIMRKRNQNDFFRNVGGTFTAGVDLAEANNNNKGGLAFYDFDNDGDFDLYWTDNDVNQIFRNDAGVYTGLGIGATPGLFNTGDYDTGIDGVAGGDVDDDGDIDLFLTSGNRSFLYINQLNSPTLGPNTGAAMTFTLDPATFQTGNGESATMIDADNDGDLDIYIQVNNGNNELYLNNLYGPATLQTNKNSVLVNLYESRLGMMPSGIRRLATGSILVLEDCNGNIVSGVREVNGGKGHGSQDVGIIHFGLPLGLNQDYKLVFKVPNYDHDANPGTAPVRVIIEKWFNPSTFASSPTSTGRNIMTLYTTDASELCPTDVDADGLTDYKDLDDDNDGIPDTDEFGCTNESMSWTNHYSTNDDPTVAAASPALTFSGVTMTPTRANPFGVLNFGEIRNAYGLTNVYQIEQNATQASSSSSVLTFSKAVVNLSLTLHDIDRDASNYIDRVVVKGYSGSYVYPLSFSDFVLGADNDYAGANSFIGTANSTNSPDGDITINFPVAIDSVVIVFRNDDGTPSGTQDYAIGDISFCVPSDADNDGVYDYLDLDSDNDGIPDIVEAGGVDTNGDGIQDDLTDTDGDGLVDAMDNDDTDGPTGTSPCSPQFSCLSASSTTVILDTDGDGTNDRIPDTDGDGVVDMLDLDADNDGIPDVVEAGGTDADGDGLADNYVDVDMDGYNDVVDGDVGNDGTPENSADALQPTGTDTNADGLADSYPEGDADNDGKLDQADLDADNDGIPDVVEAGGTDTNGDGRADDYVDTDGDGYNDVVDGDVGNDGTAENTADALQVTGPDANSDGVPDSYPNGDSDGDGIRDQLDLDVDNDGIPDVVEVGGTDVNGDGRADDYVDADNDGFNDVVDGDPTNALPTGSDVAGANTPDALQLTGADTDGDGDPNSYPNGDSDGDGIRDQLDLDVDNDGIPDVVEVGGTDENGDGRADDYVDADNDGFNDVVDGDPTNVLTAGDDGLGANTADALQTTGADTDGDGDPNSYPNGDTDGDGVRDQLDLDADNDGIPDVVEAGGTDVNGDGNVDDYVDADNDGFNDVVDGDPTNALPAGSDVAGANTADALQTTGADTDGDGNPNTYPNDDADNDGVRDQLDLDADNDGIPDVVEAGGTDVNGDGRADDYADVDGDGFNDVVDGDPTNALPAGSDVAGANTGDALQATGADTDGDGEPNSYPNGDSDGDGIRDQLDLDVDNDGIPDVVEVGGTDENGDGRADDYADVDGDGFNDVVDGDPTNALAVANDGAGANTADALQTTGADTNGDGEPNSYPNGDTDNDGVRDQLDLDADNDGIPDVVEAGGTDVNGDGNVDDYVDADNDGFNDVVDGDPTNVLAAGDDGVGANTADALQTTGADTDGDGNPNTYPNDDTDNDGVRDQLDLDADNDGIPDVVEAGGTDVNGDGRADDYADVDNDGFNDVVDGDPTNALAVANDGAGANTADALQATGADTDGDGEPNSYPNGDSDGDGLRDQLDLDVDNDGLPDVLEVGGTDENGDGRADDYVDADNDGFNDVVDGDPTNALAVANDGAGANTADALQLTGADTDGDGEPNSYPNGDSDGDGVRDQLDLDVDNDGIPDVVEAGGTDANGDGRADDYADVDNDGFNDVVDGDPTNALAVANDGAGANTADALQVTGADTDGDGEPNTYPNGDSDGDGVRDQLDLDADNDGIPDVVEAGGTDANGDGRADDYADTDNDGFNDVVDGDPTNALALANDGAGANTADALQTTGADTDGDGEPNSYPTDDADGDGLRDQLDLDADNDGLPDVLEAGGTDVNGDGRADNYADVDGDGFNDVVDGDPTNALAVANDGAGANTADALQLTGADTDGDGEPNTYPNDDADNDGLRDQIDLDADNDGIPDVVEAGGTDVNGDGRADDYADVDNDGFNDVVDGDPTNALAVANDGAGANTADALQVTGADTDGDGEPNTYPNGDSDGDGVRDQLDLDADNDGIPDVVEVGGTDVNGDGRADDYADVDNDGFNDVVDGDPTNALAVANDGAGANTADALQTTGADTDGDGEPNSYPTDDADGDGLRDQLDLDADNDGLPDVVEAGGTDVNGDGRADDYADTDNDGFNDVVDGDPTNALALANDGAGANTADALQTTGADTDGDGEPNTYPNDDADNDGLRDQIDLDADNDGIPDVVEAGGTDVNGDGRADDYADVDNDGFNDVVDGDPTNALALANDGAGANTADALQVTGADTDGDGEPNTYPNGDNDGDGLRDQLDLDADNDGIPDVVEAGGTDANGDGRADNYADADGDGFNDVVDGDPTNALALANDGAGTNTANATQLTGADTDGDGEPNSYPTDDFDGDGIRDQLDLDADNDGLPDVIEAGGTDANGDGIADNYTDADNDGFNDVVDGDPTNALALANDGAGANTANATQITGADTNNDGVPNSYPTDDTDSDGHRDQLDLDADNDGIPDIIEAGGADVDNNGMADDLTEADNDGWSSLYDRDLDNNGTVDAGPTAMILTTADGNNDGRPDNGYVGGDFDADGIPSHLDLDADNDGILDIEEADLAASDVNRDGQIDDALTNDVDNNGWSNTTDGGNGGTNPVQTTDGNNDGFPNAYTTADFENDNHPNFLDIDVDNDGIVDNTEGQATNLYVAPDNADADNDGIDDAYDNDDASFGGAGSGIIPVNKDKVDEPDYRDLDTDNDGHLDVVEGHDTDGDFIADGGSNANTGLPGGTADVDGDGLLDGYDNNTASTIATNTALEPNSHPDFFNKRSIERDWREVNTTYAVDDVNSTPLNTTTTGNVLTNDKDYEGNDQVLTGNITIDTDGDGVPETGAVLGVPTVVGGVNENGSANPLAGTLTQDANGSYTFTPTNGFIGEVTYIYQVCDNGSPVKCETAEVTIDVEPEPTTDNGELAPAPDVNTTFDDLPVSGQVLSNDNDPDGDNIAVTGNINIDTDGDGTVDGTAPLGTPSVIAGVDEDGNPVVNAGSLTQNVNGTYTFDPVPGFIGVIQYEYTVCDDGTPITCEITTVTIDVLPSVYNSTNAIDDEEFLDRGQTLNDNVLINDNDVEGDNQVGGVTLFTGPSNGSLTLNPNGTYSYTPTNPLFSGNDEFTYSVCDDGTPVICDTATVYITILPVNRDFGDGPLVYGVASHRAIRDANTDNQLDGATDIWLGTNTDFENATLPVDTDNFDDGITLGTNVAGGFPRTVTPSTAYNVDLNLNSVVADNVSYGMWVDWDDDGVYEDFYSGTVATPGGPFTTVVNVMSPASTPTATVNIRLRVDDNVLLAGDFAGTRTNGEVEDYQFLMNDPLPVEMLYFNATLQGRNTGILDWATATELNNAGYEVEHALPTNGVPQFNQIGFVDGAGTTVEMQTYDYEVPNLIPGTHYFRLKQVDFDGTSEYTVVKALEVKAPLVQKLFPTILNENSETVYVQVAEDGDYTIEVITSVGQIVQTHKVQVQTTTYFEIEMDTNRYPSGVYMIRVSNGEEVYTEKVRVE